MKNNKPFNPMTYPKGFQLPQEPLTPEIMSQVKNINATVNINELYRDSLKAVFWAIERNNGLGGINNNIKNQMGTAPSGNYKPIVLNITPGFYVGLFYAKGYGYYNSIPELNDSLVFAPGYQADQFPTPSEALAFAKSGYCNLANMDIADLDYEIPLNWLERPGTDRSILVIKGNSFTNSGKGGC